MDESSIAGTMSAMSLSDTEESDSSRVSTTSSQDHGTVHNDILHCAVERRDSRAIQRILMSHDRDVIMSCDQDGNNALHVAVKENCIQVKGP